jgi:large subunit ribosomal protein L24
MKLRKGDRVQVLQGKDRGSKGEIMRVIPKTNRVIVDGVNRAKKHQKATRATMQGGIIDKDMPISASAVAIICPTDGPTRIGYRFEESGRKVRVCKKCGGELS